MSGLIPRDKPSFFDIAPRTLPGPQDSARSQPALAQKIGIQKWIALYNRPVEGYTEIRRFDVPILTPPVGAKSGFPNRFTYPANEQVLNGTNYTAAAAAIGGDKVETKLFWDKF